MAPNLVVITFNRFLLAFIFLLSFSIMAQDLIDTSEYFKTASVEKSVSPYFDFDPYYTSLGLVWHFGGDNIHDAGDDDEQNVYWLMLRKSVLPGFILFEASVNPLPVAGGLMRKYAYASYQQAEVLTGFNVIESLTTGFQEPYALSLFLGNIITFTDLSKFTQKKNKAYVGFLFNVGNYHILSNQFIKDKWLEAEWKLKGSREFDDSRLSWHFKLGTKLHQNIEIKDTIYFSIIRGRLDFDSKWYSIFDSSGFEYRFDLDINSLNFIRHFFIVEKKWHLGNGHEFSLKLGFQWIGKDQYTGSLASNIIRNEWKFLMYPGFIF